MQPMNWNDLKYMIAVHREGTLSAASKALNVNQTTVSRRLQSLESELNNPPYFKDGMALLSSLKKGRKLFYRQKKRRRHS